MAAHARAVSVALRPHAKTHKSVRIARMQVDAGAVGICCATLGEAEVMVDAGIPGVHITSPQVTPPKIARLIALNLRAHRGLGIVVDYPENLAALDRAALVAENGSMFSSISRPDIIAPVALRRQTSLRWQAPRWRQKG